MPNTPGSPLFEPSKEAYLLRQLGRAEVVLFLGAGYSRLARNRLRTPIPTAPELSRLLWEFLRYEEPYEETPLGEVYDAALTSSIPYARIRAFLEEHLMCVEIPAVYKAMTRPLWYRLYTTNVDNLTEVVYAREREPKLDILAFPSDEILERDQALGRLQLVCLNGRLPCDPDRITFSPLQYASASFRTQPLYEQFARDYSTHPTIFIGTRLDEPLFLQYVRAREERDPRTAEKRPESFLISPHISPTKRALLERLNITPVEG